MAGDHVSEEGLAAYLDTVRRQDAALAALAALRAYPTVVDAATGVDAAGPGEARATVRRTANRLDPSAAARATTLRTFAEVTAQRVFALDVVLPVVAGEIRAAADEARARAVRRALTVAAATTAAVAVLGAAAYGVARRRRVRTSPLR